MECVHIAVRRVDLGKHLKIRFRQMVLIQHCIGDNLIASSQQNLAGTRRGLTGDVGIEIHGYRAMGHCCISSANNRPRIFCQMQTICEKHQFHQFQDINLAAMFAEQPEYCLIGFFQAGV